MGASLALEALGKWGKVARVKVKAASVKFEAAMGWSAFEETDGAVWRYRARGAAGVVAMTRGQDGKIDYDATHNDHFGNGSSLATRSRRKAAWFAMKGTLEGLPKARKYARAPLPSRGGQ